MTVPAAGEQVSGHRFGAIGLRVLFPQIEVAKFLAFSY